MLERSFCCLITCTILSGGGLFAQVGDYAVLDEVAGSFVNLNFTPVRPLVHVAADDLLYVVNSHRSTIEVFASGQSTPVAVYPAPYGPVSIAYNESSADELLVVCRGTSALMRMDRATGTVTALVKLPAEPGDIVVDKSRQVAYVSCAGVNAIARIALSNNKVTIVDHTSSGGTFRCVGPQFLALDSAGRVLVAPLFSGNNTAAERFGTLVAGAAVIDLSDPYFADVAAGGGLPDEDLFRIDFNATPSITVEVAAKNVGAVLLGNGFQSATSFWQLNTSANNAIPSQQTEPLVNGVFAQNRLTIIDLSGALPVAVPDAAPIDLDRLTVATGSPIDRARAVGQPYALAFEPTTGKGFIAGLLTDNVLAVDATGAFSHEFDLPDGSIPRGLRFSEDGTRLFVDCWGTNEVRVYTPLGTWLETFSLSNDPTPPLVKTGRTLFYDASKSRDNNVSCATCHVDGGTDMLVWNLSAGEVDDKGPMLTQTLRGIEKVQPLHWRGERPGLVHFNPAFEGLLGGAELDPTEFAAFEAFVFSLTPRANPYEDRSRRLNAAIDPPRSVQASSSAPNAVMGQDSWILTPTFANMTCNACHLMPTGTLNDIFHDAVVLPLPKRNHFKMAPFQEFWRRGYLPTLDAKIWADPTDPTHAGGYEIDLRPFVGGAVSHAGLVKDALAFVGSVGQVGADPVLQDNLNAFLFQHDQSIAPAVHEGLLLDVTTAIANGPELTTYLEPQARNGNCDLVVFGVARSAVLPGNPVVARRWSFDRNLGVNGEYVCDDPTEPNRVLSTFFTYAPIEWNVFFGVPVGMGEPTGVDSDLDGLRDVVDAAPYTPYVDPSDNADPIVIGNAIGKVWQSARTARLEFQTNEPTRYRIDLTENGVPLATIETFEFARSHAPLLTGLKPSTAPGQSMPMKTFAYAATVTVYDRKGNDTSYVANLDTEDFVRHPNFEEHVVSSLEWLDQTVVFDITQSPPVAQLRARVKATTSMKQGGPPAVAAPNRIVIYRVLRNGVPYADFTPKSSRTFKADVIVAAGSGGVFAFEDEGPYLIAGTTDSTGGATVKFDVDGLANDDEVTIEVALVFEQSTDPIVVSGFGQDLQQTTAGILTGTPGPDYDTDGDTIPDAYGVFVPAPGSPWPPNTAGTAPPMRRFGQWSFPDTPPDARKLVKDI